MQMISIWQPSEKDGRPVWERPQPELLGDHYAQTRYLWPKTAESPTRICFFGESVAAGYLFAPHVTPAKVLQAQLDDVVGADAYEVVDLARTNETLAGLVETIRKSIQLEPDCMVIFAGNNWNLLETPEWSPYLPGVKGRQRYAEQLKVGGLEAVIETAAKERLQKVWLALAKIGTIAKEAVVPVVLVIPEVNLLDWENCQPVTWLDGEDLARWYESLDGAKQAWEAGNYEEVVTLAKQMLDLDGGICPTAYSLLVKANASMGKMEVARKAADAEIGSSYYATMAFLSAPQAGPMEQEILRRAASFNGFTAVDLPVEFATKGALPDRDLFVDYCHLTLEGMDKAMGAVTTAVLGLMNDSPPTQISEVAGLEISKEAIATAHFGAAIHNAHRLCGVTNKQEILVHWCLSALEESPAIHQTMIDFVAARSLPYPAVLTAEQQRLFNSPYLLQHQHGWKYNHLDVEMIRAILTALAQWEPAWAEAALERLVQNGALGDEGLSLLEGYSDAEPLRRFFPELMPTPDLTGWAIYRSPWPESSFCFVMGETADIDLDINLRLPKPAIGESTAVLLANETRVGELMVQTKWTRHKLTVDGRYLNRGLNTLTVRWPFPNVKKEEIWEEVIGRLEQGLETTIHPVFGEIETLKVKLAGP